MTLRTGVNRVTALPRHAKRDTYLVARNAASIGPICPALALSSTKEPWPTVVLGSGCTASARQKKALEDVVARLSPLVPESIEVGSPGELVRSFARDLIRDRLRLQPDENLAGEPVAEKRSADPSAPRRKEVVVPTWAVQLLLAAALMTKLYNKIKFLGSDAPRRPEHDDEALLKVEPPPLSWNTIKDEYVDPSRSVLKSLMHRSNEIARGLEGPADNLESTVKELLCRLDSGLATGGVIRIELRDLHALAEFSWLCLTTVANEPVYPGWGDLLLDLSNYDLPTIGRVGRPSFKSMIEAQTYIASRYRKVTENSWSRLLEALEETARAKKAVALEARAKIGGGVAARDPERTQADKMGCDESDALYAAAGQLLNAQHQNYISRQETVRPPLATMFVTSFDLELELSLLSLGEPFTVVLPVHLNNSKNAMLNHCWIATQVRAEQPLEGRLGALMTPDPSSCRVLVEGDLNRLEPEGGWGKLGNHLLRGEELMNAAPFVVRLAGCPLITLPDLKTVAARSLRDALEFLFGNCLRDDAHDDKEAYQEIVQNRLELKPAIIIDEHDAIVQGQVDLLSFPGDAQTSLRLGLPAELAAGNQDFSRYWMMLGVQIHDSAVRHRVATLISSLPYMISSQSPPAGADPEPKPRGVAVNRYPTELEQDVLSWNGFDVVCDDVSRFAQDLRHCADHMRQRVAFNLGGNCGVKR